MAFNSRGRRSGSLIRETTQLRPTHVPGGTGCALHQRRKPCALSTSSSITHAPAGSLLGTAPEHLLHGNERREALTISGEEGKREGRDIGEGGLTLVIENSFEQSYPHMSGSCTAHSAVSSRAHLSRPHHLPSTRRLSSALGLCFGPTGQANGLAESEAEAGEQDVVMDPKTTRRGTVPRRRRGRWRGTGGMGRIVPKTYHGIPTDMVGFKAACRD